ncbi:hypothetical protein [Alienimonas sp. DA493]|uniref:hypothetical protein n=1 Tax=Alienimonas sp. DA493 TaxID=3373605 RepID=UPI0037552A7E
MSRPRKGESPAEFAAREVRKVHRPSWTRWIAFVAALSWVGAVWFAWTTRDAWPRDGFLQASAACGGLGLALCRGGDRLIAGLALLGAVLLWLKLNGM